jgi:hypothetical protein
MQLIILCYNNVLSAVSSTNFTRSLADVGNVLIWRELVHQNFDTMWKGKVSTSTSISPEATTVPKKAKPKIRMCTTTIKNIIRPELADQANVERIIGTIEQCQDEVTDVIDELSVVVLQHTISVSLSILIYAIGLLCGSTYILCF